MNLVTPGRRRTKFFGTVPGRLLVFLLLLSAAFAAQAQKCSDFPGGVIDGDTGTPAPAQLQLDRSCTIRNYPASNPWDTNMSFQTVNDGTKWLIIFDNVVHTGNMSCNSVAGHTIWFVNGSSTQIQEGCQNLLIPVEKIDKQVPSGQTTAVIGVPFTYMLKIPVLYDPATQTVFDDSGSPNELHSISITDDLNATGADLSYVSHTAYWQSSGLPVAHNFSNTGGLLSFDGFPIVPPFEQIIIEITVVLDNTPANVIGNQFVNTAKWDFGRLIDGVFYDPLPGEWGISPPLTIAAPELTLTKTGPATLGVELNLGQWGQFGLDVQNTGLVDAWNVTIVDRLPDGPNGGVCDTTPEILSAQVFASDGVTPVPGKGPLVAGTDYSFSVSGTPQCEITFTVLSAAGVIGPGERLIISYRTRLDADSKDGVVLTNVAGAVEWFDSAVGSPYRQTYTRVVTNGTVGTVDHQDAHSFLVALSGIFYEKTVQNLSTGANPATTARPGDTLRYSLRLQSTDTALADIGFLDDLGSLNPGGGFQAGTLSLVPGSIPPAADTSNTDPNGGSGGTGLLDIRNLSLPTFSEVTIQFDIMVDPTLADGAVVTNQSDLLASGFDFFDSDDPTVNGQSDPSVIGDEDPTRVTITAPIPSALGKANMQATAAVGDTFSYQITVPSAPHTAPLYDVRILDDLSASAADLQFVSVSKISGSGAWTPVNTGTASNLIIEDTVNGIDIPAGEQIVVEVTVLLLDTPANIGGLTFTNTASYTYNLSNGNDLSQRTGAAGSTQPMTIVEPDMTLAKSGPATLALGVAGSFVLDAQNTGTAPAYDITITDVLPDGAVGGMCDAAPTGFTAQVFQADGTTPVSGVLVNGVDYTANFVAAPTCTLTISMQSAAAVVGPTERLIVSYQAAVDNDSQQAVTLTNVAGVTEWSSSSGANARTLVRSLTDGTVGTVDHEDAHDVTVTPSNFYFEKTVQNLSTGVSPATTAAPGDTLRYSLRLQVIGSPLFNVAFYDDLGSLNATPVFQPGTLSLVGASIPPGADTSFTDPNGGSNGTGLLDIRGLDLAADTAVTIQFDIVVDPGLTDGTFVINQSDLLANGVVIADSDDPNVNGQADPLIAGDEDPTQLVIEAASAPALTKANTQTTAAVGDTFNYRITVPSVPHTAPLYDVRILDDLTASAADLQFVGVSKISGSGSWTPVNTGTATNLVIEDTVDGIDIPAGEQIVVEVTVQLLDTPTNSGGLNFTNTASYSYNLSNGNDLSQRPGGPGTTAPMTIVEPDLTLSKSGPAQLNLGQMGVFTLDVQNIGNSTAYGVTLGDLLPNAANGGMCDAAPSSVTAQVFEADGVTPVSGVLVAGTDYSTSFAGDPACAFTLTTLTTAAAIGPTQRLIVDYQARFDIGSQDGVVVTNVAGATQWLSSSGAIARTFSRSLTNGTVGTVDHEDAHSVTLSLSGYFFEKTVENLTSGVNPAATAAPGDTLRYSLRLQTTDSSLLDLTFYDDLGAMNATPVFQPGSLTLVAATIPPGADTSFTDPNGGTNGTGLVDIRNLSLGTYSQLLIQFDIVVDATLSDGTFITNQSDLLASGVDIADSDDPNVNGQASPAISGDEDPTQLIVETAPASALAKANTQATATIGETFSYRITVPSVPHTAPIYDVRIGDDLAAAAADLQFVGVTKVSGSGAWTPVNTGTATNLVIEDTANGIDIPAGEQAVVEITVLLRDTPTNVDGLAFTNTASYTYNLLDGNNATARPGAAGATPPMTVAEPELTLVKSGPAQMQITLPGSFTLDVHNTRLADAWGVTIVDQLPNGANGGMCDAAPTSITAQIFEADGVTPVSGVLAAGTDYTTSFAGDPTCTLTITMQSAAAVIGPDQRLIVTYQTLLDADSQESASLVNIAAATAWTGGNMAEARSYARNLTDGTVGTLDHEDAHTVLVELPVLLFEKTVANVSSGQTPASTAQPGDVLRYTIRVENQTNAAFSDVRISDDLGALNAMPVFQAGTLNLIAVPAGADTSATNPSGGTNGTGLLDVAGLSFAGLGDVLQIEFEITLLPVIANASAVSNQSQLTIAATPVAVSDDPNINGPADPSVSGDEDPTRLTIQSAPVFRVRKTSADVSGDPAELLAGDTLRYTITVKNIGTDNATDAVLRDQIPASTSYVSGSTSLNGVAVADVAGTSPLVNGLSIYAPENPTPGAMRADASATPNNVATVGFDVIVDPNALDGTIISNQGFVSAIAGNVVDQPSDDPATATADDPTRDVVGSLPLLYADKSVVISSDGGTPNVVDPNDVLRYTITISNSSGVAANAVVLSDSVPADTTYVADSLSLNGSPVGQPDGGVFLLASGVAISSQDLTPPLPGPGLGTISPGASAVVQFELRVDGAATPGSLISNQAVVASLELPDLLTDGDGNPATGPEPTVVVVGDAQQLAISKQVAVVGGGPAVAGATLEYVVQVSNIGSVPAYDVVIYDDLNLPVAGQLIYVANSASLDGLLGAVTEAGGLLTADYSALNGPLQPGASTLLRFRATLDPNLAIGTTVTNTADVTWNTALQSASASVSIDVGGTPGIGILNGRVWHDADFDLTADAGERLLQGWTVQLVRNGQPIATRLTALDGSYSFSGVAPNYLTMDQYELRFAAPGASANTASLGRADSAFTNDLQRISDIVVMSGSNLQDLNLPISPDGVVYDSITRAPVAGSTLTLLQVGGTPLPSGCFDDSAQQGQVALVDGYYRFDLNFSDPACPNGGDYLIGVTPPPTGYLTGVSQIIPASSDATTLPLDVPACPGTSQDAVLATGQHCEAQVSEFAPGVGVPARSTGTVYYLNLRLDSTQIPGSNQIFNNHIPLDPDLGGAVSITKTTPLVGVSRGQLVPYVITANNTLGFDLTDVSIVDRFPAGFRYVEGSARLNGVATEPAIVGRELIWSGLSATASGSNRIELLLAVGAGVSDGEYTNRAQVMHSLTGNPLSGEATATVRLTPDPTFDCTDVYGKVFNDLNRDGVQDLNENGIPGVRVVTARGLAATTDQYGQFHFTCAITPNERRGSNFILKLDDRTLPTGYRSSVDTIQIQRATRGKALRFSFGASIHRVIGLDIADPVFVPDSTEIRRQWLSELDVLMLELQKAPATLRLSYLADVEDPRLVDRRLEAVKDRIMLAWLQLNCCYRLVIEPEIFWRRGAPPERRPRGGR